MNIVAERRFTIPVMHRADSLEALPRFQDANLQTTRREERFVFARSREFEGCCTTESSPSFFCGSEIERLSRQEERKRKRKRALEEGRVLSRYTQNLNFKFRF